MLRYALLFLSLLPVAIQALVALGSKPNIIFILADDLGYGDLGCFGQTKVRTPVLDKMAAEGIKLTSFYSGSTVCAPARLRRPRQPLPTEGDPPRNAQVRWRAIHVALPRVPWRWG